MGKSVVGTWVGVGQSFLDNYTYYYNLNFIVNMGSSYEARIETPVREAGVLSNFSTYVTSYTGSGTCTVTVRKSRADTSMSVSYATSQWGYKEDTTNTATFANTDELAVKVVVPGEAGSRYLYILHSHAVFTPTDTGKTITFLGSAWGTFQTASTTRYIGVNGTSNPATTEENEKTNVAGTFTWKNFYVHCGANSRTTNTVFKNRKNGADGNQTVTFGNLETGTKEDTSNTDSLADGDDINYSITTGTGTESIEINIVASMLSSTSSEWMWSTSGYGVNVAFNKTFYDGLNGYATSQDTTESNIRMLPRFDLSAKKLAAYSSANTLNGTSTLTLRDNGADSAIAVSWGSSETGWKYDNSDVVDFTGGTDYIVYKLATGGTTGNFSFQRASLLGYTSSGRTGSASITLDASTLSSTGTVKIAGAFSQALADIALSSTSGKVLVQGVLSSLLADILLESAASQLSPISGVLSVTLGDAVLASAGAVALKGTSSLLLDPFGQSFAGKVLVRGNSGITLADLTPSSAGKVLVSGLGPIQLGDLILAGGAAGKVLVSGNAAVALQDLLTSTAGKVLVAGAASIPLADLLMLASGGAPPDIDEIILLLNGRICKKITDTIYIML